LVFIPFEVVYGSDSIKIINIISKEFSKNEKKSSTEIYLGRSSVWLKAPSEKIWDEPIGYYKISDSLYCTKQGSYETNYKFSNQSGLELGFLKNYQLSSHLSLSYGAGLDLIRFDFTIDQRYLEERLISKLKILEYWQYNPWVFIETPVNEPIPYRMPYHPYVGFDGTTEHRVILLQLPVGISYMISPSLFTGIFTSVKLPLRDEILGEYYNFSKKKYIYDIISDAHIFSRITAFARISLKYFFTKEFSLSMQYESSISNNFRADAQDYFNNFIPSKVSTRLLNFSLGYNF
jgi:hypothetical protein